MNKRQFKVPHDIAGELFREALWSANYIRLDEIPEGSARRVQSNQSIGWAYDAIRKSDRPRLTCIERSAFLTSDPDYFEFAMSTMSNIPEYILWIHVPIPQAEILIKKYKLTQLC